MWRVCASLQKREASAAATTQRGLWHPGATRDAFSSARECKAYVATRISRSVLAPFTRWSVQVAKLLFRCTRCNCFSMMVDPLPPGMGSPALPWHHGVKWKPGASPAHLTHIIGSRPHYSFVSSGWQAWRRHSGPLLAPRGSAIRRHHCCASAHAWPLSEPLSAAAPVPRMVRAAPRAEPPRLAAM